MTSAINPNNINGAYPVAGQDNNSQGFRDNFTNTGTNFQFAANEITDLQNKVIVSAQLLGGSILSTQNNLLGAPLINALISDFAAATIPLGVVGGSVNIDYAAGHYQTLTTNAPVTLGFSNLPAAGQLGLVTVQITVSNTVHSLTMPGAVSVNIQGIQGYVSNTNMITFAATGVYTFTFLTSNGGSTITVNETNKQLQPFNSSSDSVTSGACSLATATSYFTAAGSATLGAGVPGQIKVLTQTAAASMVIIVTSAGWTGSGTVTLAARGASCTLQYTYGSWYCIGNNSATFA